MMSSIPSTIVEAAGRGALSFSAMWADAVDIWMKGGWAMGLLAIDALLLFGLGVHVLQRLIGKRFRTVPEKTLRLWLDHPEYREGKIGRLLAEATQARTLEESSTFFLGLHQSELSPIARDLKVMKVCIAAAPLLGLLGTVTGMLSTFGALAVGSGGEKTMAAVSRGISEALITTETGLVIALPGMFFHYQLGRMRDCYDAFLQHLETLCAQHLYRQIKARRQHGAA